LSLLVGLLLSGWYTEGAERLKLWSGEATHNKQSSSRSAPSVYQPDNNKPTNSDNSWQQQTNNSNNNY
jgi:hypothetical protein